MTKTRTLLTLHWPTTISISLGPKPQPFSWFPVSFSKPPPSNALSPMVLLSFHHNHPPPSLSPWTNWLQKEGIDYKETFFPVSKKDSLCIIMILVAHFDLELQQMDVKTTFLNENLEKRFTWNNQKDFPLVVVSIWYASLRNPYMDWNKHHVSGIWSFMMLSLHLVSWRTLWINVYIRKSVGVRFVSLFYMWMTSFLQPMIKVCYMRWNNFYLKPLTWSIWVVRLMSLALRYIETNFKAF